MMQKHGVFLLSVLILSLFLFVCPAHAGTWPANREELAEANLTGRIYYFEDTPGDARKEWAKLWVQKNYGEDAVILSTRRIAAQMSSDIDVKRLLDGYTWLSLSTWEVTFRIGTLLDDLEQSDGTYTVSTQVVCLDGEYSYPYWSSTLVGFLPPEETLHDLFEVREYLQEDPRFADSLADLRTIVPEGVTEIDLRTVLGNDVVGVENAWMLSTNACVILRLLPDNEGIDDSGSDYEIILLDMHSRSILSRTSVPNVYYNYRQGWENSAFYLLFEPEGVRRYDPTSSCIKVTVARDGTVRIDDSVPGRLTVMPGGKTAVRTANDGSLYAVDVITGEEELLIQGVPALGLLWDEGYSNEEIAEYFPSFEEDYRDAVAAYVPFWDELPENWDEELNDNSWPFESTRSSDIFSIRQFHVEEPLDEHRFVYRVFSWEWCNGYGVYDLRTRTDHRITGRGYFYGVAGGKIFGSTLMADANTYETSPLPESVREQLAEIHSDYATSFSHAISPDGRLLALTSVKSWDVGISAVTITDIQTGNTIKTYDIRNPSAIVSSAVFYDDARFMLFFRAEDFRSAFIYLFDIEK